MIKEKGGYNREVKGMRCALVMSSDITHGLITPPPLACTEHQARTNDPPLGLLLINNVIISKGYDGSLFFFLDAKLWEDGALYAHPPPHHHC